MITWPETVIPYPSRSLTLENDPRLLVQEFEIGTRQRKRFSESVERVELVWQLSVLQWAFLKSFVASNISEGAESISITIPTASADGLERVEAKIVGGRLSHQYLAPDAYDVRATIEIVGPPVMPERLIDAILFVEGNTYDDLFVALESKLTTHLESLNYP